MKILTVDFPVDIDTCGEMMKLLIVDDHVLFREGLASIVRSEADIEIVGLAGSLFVVRFWCRFLCPAGAFLSLLNPTATP